MKTWACILALAYISCSSPEQETKSSGDTASDQPSAIRPAIPNSKEVYWTGTLNGKTPVFIHYQIDSNVIAGEITYLGTKNRLPIRLLGTMYEDKSCRLMEFDKTGNITGVIVGTPAEKEFNGTWVSPKTGKELEMKLRPKDTAISIPPMNAAPGRMSGLYRYAYGEGGAMGSFEFSEAGDGKAVFEIEAFTSVEKGMNDAIVEKDTITFNGDNFIYTIPDTDSCEFKVKFYKDFVYIDYTKGYCTVVFGLNASIDGIFLKRN